MTENNQPIYILPEGTRRDVGSNAQTNNIMAAKIVAETVRTTLGPKGMDKMLVDSLGDVTVTNDGVTILEEMNIEHPAAKMIVEIAKTQEDEVGDGTTTAVVLAGELLKKAQELLDQKIHPTVITKGYRIAAEKALVILDNISETCTRKESDILLNLAKTAMTGKGAENAKEVLSDVVLRAVLAIAEDKTFEIEDIKIETKVGATISESELVEGIVLDKERVNSGMPKSVANAKIVLIDSALEIKDTETDAKIQITQPGQMQAFLDMEEQMIKKMVDQIVATGANVLFCQKGIDEVAQHFLSKKGIVAIRRVKKSDLERIAKATGATIKTNFDDLSAKDLGIAGLVEEQKVGDEAMIFVRDCKRAKSVTILIRGGTEHVVAEIKRAVEDAIGGVASAVKSGKVVGGAGASEMELSRNLNHYAESLSGREQLSVRAFAQAMEAIPKTLAENAGLDPIDVLAEMKAAHDKGQKWAGINVFTGRLMDGFKEGVIEPLKIKTQAISSSSEVAIMILRIDDVIAAGKSGAQMGANPGDMPDMM